MSAIEAITVPKWGLTMTEGTLTEWLIKEGDIVAVGDVVADMETSKIVNQVESNVAGVVRRLVAQPGDTLEIAHLLGVVAAADTPDAEIDAFVASFAPDEVARADVLGSGGDDSVETPVSEEPAVETETTLSTAPSAAPANAALAALADGDDDSAIHASRYARQLAKEQGVNLHNVTATGRNNRISKNDVIAVIEAAGGAVARPEADKSGLAEVPRSTQDDSQVKATAVARRLAKQLGINLHDCRASGTRGRVSKADVEVANALLNGAPATPEAVATGTIPEEQATPAFVETPMTGMRKTIAARLQESKREAPHFRLTLDCCLDELLSLRQQINASEPGVKLSVNDFIIKATAMALAKSPAVNVQFDGDTIRQFKHADVSVAVALDNGLITPIVKAADTLSLSEISAEVRNLATRAKAGTLKPEEFMGGTFSISNLGMYGIKQFDAIINPPQSGILAVGAGEKRVVVDIDGEGEGTRVANMVTLSASFDHRVVDGAVGAEFMALLKRYLETPALMLA